MVTDGGPARAAAGDTVVVPGARAIPRRDPAVLSTRARTEPAPIACRVGKVQSMIAAVAVALLFAMSLHVTGLSESSSQGC